MSYYFVKYYCKESLIMNGSFSFPLIYFPQTQIYHFILFIFTRTFGYPAERSRSATFSCKNRYTNRSICAVPCDKIDDLCEDFMDEQCQDSSTETVIIFVVVLVTITVIVSELLMAIHNYKVQSHITEEIQLDQESNDLIQFLNRINDDEGSNEFDTLHNSNEYPEKVKFFVHKFIFKEELMSLAPKWKQFELDFHKQNESDFHFCVKNNLGTNGTTKNLLKLLSPPSKIIVICQKLGFTKILKMREIFSSENVCFVKVTTFLLGFVTGILNIGLYFIDLVKDVVFAILLRHKISVVLQNFETFGFQMFFITILSLLLPMFAKFVYLADCFLKRTLEVYFAILMLILLPIAPAIASYMCSRFEATLAMTSKSTINMKEIDSLGKKCQNWKLSILQMKFLEISLENSLQMVIMLAAIALSTSSTSTVFGIQNLFTGDVIEFVILSAVASVFSTILGQMKWFSGIKNGFMTMTGNILIGIQVLMAVVTRIGAILLFFGPSLGLFDLLGHLKTGSLPTTTGYQEYDLIYDIMANGTVIFLSQGWVEIKSYTELTNWSLEIYYKVFMVMVAIHFIGIACIKSFLYGFRGWSMKRALHCVTQIMCPSTFQDWDDEIHNYEDVKRNWKRTSTEMKLLLAWFLFENIAMCFPIWILFFNIEKRNQFLDVIFLQVPEEQKSTNLAMLLSVCCPLMFILSSLLQYAMFCLYHRFGHPWQLILKEALTTQPEKISNEEETDSNDQNDETPLICANGNNSDDVIENEENKFEVKVDVEKMDEESISTDSSPHELQSNDNNISVV